MHTCLLKVLGKYIHVYMHVMHVCINRDTCDKNLNVSKTLFLGLEKIWLLFLEIQRRRSCLVTLKNDL